MANHKSAIKRNRQNIKTREHNRAARLNLRNTLKKARLAVASKDAEAAKLVLEAERALAKASQKHLIHKNNAARRISRLKAGLVAKAK